MQNYWKLHQACRFYPYEGRSEQPEFLIHTPHNRQFKVSALAKEILQRLDGQTSLETIADDLQRRSVEVTVEELQELMETQYRNLGVFENLPDTKGAAPPRTAQAKLPFLLHWDLLPETYVRRISVWLKPLFHLYAVIPGLLLILAAHYLVYFPYSAKEFLSNASFLWVLFLALLSVLFHEFGHSSAVSRFGGNPGKIGFGLYVLLPSFYADVSEVWRFPRKQRMVVDVGGVYFQQLTYVVFTGLGLLTAKPEFFVACRFIDLMTMLTLNPIFQFDGYWLLVDYLAIPNLYRLAVRYLAFSIKRLFKRAEAPALPPMPRPVYGIFIVYAIVCNLFLAFVVWVSYRYLHSTFVRFPSLFPETFKAMLFALKTQDLPLFVNRLLTLFFLIAFPGTALLGLISYAGRLVFYVQAKIQDLRISRREVTSKIINLRQGG